MTVDVIAAILVGIAVFLGWRAGAVSQIGRAAAAVLAVLGAPLGAPVMRDILFADADLSAPVIEAGCLLGAGLVIYLAVALTGWMVVRAMRAASEHLNYLDRLGGGAIGGVKGVVLVYFVLTVVLLVDVPLQSLDPPNAMKLRGGYATTFVRNHNILAPWQLPKLAELHDALKVGYYAEQLDRQRILLDHPKAVDFLRKQAIDALSDDRALMQAVIDDRYPVTLSDPRIRAVLSDSRLTSRLSAIDWAELLDEIQSPIHS